jgi:hypothetical protein
MSVNTKNDISNHYFSGQGVVLIGQRDASGNAGALLTLGNVTALKIAISNSVVDHKGSQDGQRSIDKRLTTETKGSISIALENLEGRNLATALRGSSTQVAAGTVVAAADTAYVGAVSGLPYINIAALVVTTAADGWSGASASALTEYTNDATPWDYKWNADAGSFRINSGNETAAPVKAAIPLSGTPAGTITAGSLAITALTAFQAAITGAAVLAVGDTVTLWGVTGAGAASVNGVKGVISAVTATTLTVAIPGSAGVVVLDVTTLVVPVSQGTTGLPFPFPVTLGYTYSNQKLVDALNTSPQEMFLRFEGLNTAESNGADFSPVVVEVFRFSVDPLKELSLIGDTFGVLTIEGAVLSDASKTTGSKFFQVKKLT